MVYTHLDDVETNSWIGILGIIITISGVAVTLWSIWKTNASIKAGSQLQSDQRVREVMNRFIHLWVSREKNSTRSALPIFLDSGALTLSESEMKKCARLIASGGYQNPLDDPLLSDHAILLAAKEKGVDLDQFASRVSFLIGHHFPEENRD